MMLYSRITGRILLMLAVAGTLALPTAAQPNDALYQVIDDACTEAEAKLKDELKEIDWSKESRCKAGELDEAVCRSDVEFQIEKAVQKEILEIRKQVLTALAPQAADQVGPLYKNVDQGLSQLSQEMSKSEVVEQGLQKLQKPSELEQLSKEAVADFARTCRIQVIPAVSAGDRDDGSDHLASLQKETGFSQVVRCKWQSDANHHRLNCAPGLRVTGHDIAVIQILPPADESFRLRWVQAIGTEELPGTSNRGDSAYLDKLRCPAYKGSNAGKINLACDELCFSSGGPCDSGQNYRPLETQSAVVAVHTQRRFSTTYGCAVHRRECAQRRLRPDPDQTQPAKLTLLTRGRSPAIRVRAMDQNGNLAEGEVLVGYQRWRVETGGFIGFTTLVDEEVVTRVFDPESPGGSSADNEESGEIEVLKIGDSDSYSQETGIFVNFIPSNYEFWGLSLGFATADGSAPSVYLGPTIRLRTFGNRGLASLSFGAVMRQVDRFPDLRHLRTIQPQENLTLPADSRFLEADRQFDVDGFVGIQLGFSFGPISVPDSDD